MDKRIIDTRKDMWGHGHNLIIETPCKHGHMERHEDYEWYVWCEGGVREQISDALYELLPIKDSYERDS